MLKSLFIQHYVLIDNLDIRFSDSFTVITGETGAGKSIILGALSLVLGQRADTKCVKSGEDKCVIEAVFDISQYHMKDFFVENDLDFDERTCTLRRELFSSGKTRTFVNDSPVALHVMRDLGAQLIDIHSQHQNLLLGNTKFQMQVVDVMAQNKPLLQSYGKEYSTYESARRQLASVKEKVSNLKQEEDYIRSQFQQLDEAQLTDNEQEDLENEQETLTHAEDIKAALYKIATLMNGDDTGGLLKLKEARATAQALERYYPAAHEMAERLDVAYIDLKDLANETESGIEEIDSDPDRLQFVERRLDTLYTLQQKHRLSSVAELIELRETLRRRLDTIESSDEQLAALSEELEIARQRMLEQAELLSRQRMEVAGDISARIVDMLAQLGMPNARFSIELLRKQSPDADGMDDVRFLFAANRTTDLESVAIVASGGEVSRLMLCIKAMIAGFTALPAIIFDEVDMGVSGDIADRMGNIMQELGAKMQVIAITHLPQVASKGKEHYFVYKQDTSQDTLTQIRKLTHGERINEVARMLSGASLTDASIANARELLQL
ncbi:MAG: DNA repair protein RecN [Tannerellaceae bacterium]|jgi:DNA repair protein RecN (Recombination protein N)|nr:DNA repair protein RecN [Tannerellaceae bacterium]